jgi:alpha-D-ribose 1-methylphosphonate 5-triphosphate diphosphatase
MELVLKNANLVLGNEVVRGDIAMREGVITAIDPASRSRDAIGEDLDGDFLAPGIVDLHTDCLEKHFFPRPGIDWNPVSAAITHDGACLSVGVTTVFDSLSLGSFGQSESRSTENLDRLVAGLLSARDAGALRADHRIHWRCELPSDVLQDHFNRAHLHPMTGLVSLMDHTPGQRQYMKLDRFLDRVWRKEGVSEADIAARMNAQYDRQARNVAPNRAHVAEGARSIGVPIAAHDDETESHVEAAAAAGATIAEFPVTPEAARRSHELGMSVIMGGPNLVRGGSYSGNLSAAEAARSDMLDGLASDYVPRSLVESAFILAQEPFGWGLPAAFAAVSAAPARSVGLDDRGEIAVGKRADLIRIRLVGGLPVVRGVWVTGQRAA